MTATLKRMTLALVLAFSLAAVGFTAPDPPQATANITGIEFQKVESRLEVLVKVEGDFNYETFELTGPKRLVIDVTPIGQITAAPSLSINDTGVIGVRTARFKAGTGRIVFDLAEKSPSHRVSKVESGLMVLFWMEAAGRPADLKDEAVAAKKTKTKPVPKKPRPEKRPPASKEYSGTAFGMEKEFFFQLRGGLGLFPKPSNESVKTFDLYGETATLKENYKLKTSLAFDAKFGKFFKPKLRAGVGATLWAVQYDGIYDFTLPHPFTENSPRTAIFTEDLKDSVFNFYVFALFKVMESEKLRLWLGPAAGFATGKFQTLSNYQLEDKSPFSSSDISLNSTEYVEDSASGITISGIADLEYVLSPSLSLLLNADFHYFNPKIENTGKRLNFIVAQLTLGLQVFF